MLQNREHCESEEVESDGLVFSLKVVALIILTFLGIANFSI